MLIFALKNKKAVEHAKNEGFQSVSENNCPPVLARVNEIL
jgi:hypothetical protein